MGGADLIIFFDKLMHSFRYDVIDKHFNELEGNERLEDRGSIYYLIQNNQF